MDPDIEKWLQKAPEYCTICGGSGKLHINVTGCRKLDFKTCQSCKGTGTQIIVKTRASEYERATKPWINEFETQTTTNEKNIQQPKETRSTDNIELSTFSGSFSEPRQSNTGEKRNKKPGLNRYAIPGTGGENHPVFLHQGEVR
jgi:ribosome-binding protein aMBF1 (putative translation factor)